MNIILKKDGTLSVVDSPLQGKDADLANIAAFISNPSDGDSIVYNGTKGIWEVGQGDGGGSLVVPVYTVTEIDAETGAFTCTCDKTFAEIKAAIDAGQCFFAKVGEEDGFTFASLVSYFNEDAGEYIGWEVCFVSSSSVASSSITHFCCVWNYLAYCCRWKCTSAFHLEMSWSFIT